MRNIIQRIVVLILVCLVLGIIASWSTSNATRLGEEVPNDVAATLRGGADCEQWGCFKVSVGTCPYYSPMCKATPGVVYDDPNSILSYYSDCCDLCVYCGGYNNKGQLDCVLYPTHEGLPCDQ